MKCLQKPLSRLLTSPPTLKKRRLNKQTKRKPTPKKQPLKKSNRIPNVRDEKRKVRRNRLLNNLKIKVVKQKHEMYRGTPRGVYELAYSNP